ncbi:MAG TPA: S8 family serine peptidase [Candidatus Deferrimicrobium sp.]|nr:S8 family serine peptidase [Candidatus Deferrimicrobium sp.]
MKKTCSYSITVCLTLAALGMCQAGGENPHAVNVIAKENLFGFGGSGKISPEYSNCSSAEVSAFLDSLGALYLSKIFPNFDSADTLSVNEEGDTVTLINLSEYYQIEFADSVHWQDLQSAWAGTDSFEVIEQSTYFTEDVVAVNDPKYYWQDYLKSTYAGSQNIDGAWSYTTGNGSIRVCVVDDGIDINHEDLASRITLGYNAENDGEDISPLGGDETHGTHVAGIISAATNNSIGIAGVNWNSALYIARAATYMLGSKWYDDKNTGRAVEWATRMRVDIINMSFGYSPGGLTGGLISLFRGNALAAACFNAWQKGVLLVASKGNEATDTYHYPSDLPTVMGVGSCNLLSAFPSSFTNYGPSLDVLANGEGVMSTVINNGYEELSGTSMASPVVAGVASLLKSYKPDLTADEIEQIIELTAKDKGDPGWDASYGWGIVKADSAQSFVANNLFIRKEATSYSRQLAWGSHEVEFHNNGGLPSGHYFGVETYRLTHHFDYPEYNFSEPPDILLRLRGTKGWENKTVCIEFPYARVVPGSITTTGCDVETYSYFVKYNLLGQRIDDWWPCDNPPCNANPNIKFKITVAGRPNFVAVSGLNGASWSIEATMSQFNRVSWVDYNIFEEGTIVERRQIDSSTWVVLNTVGPCSLCMYDDTGVVGSETYAYRVRPIAAGFSADYSPEKIVETAPGFPRGFVGEVVKVFRCQNPLGHPDTSGRPLDSVAKPYPDSVPTCPTNAVRLWWYSPANQKGQVHYEVWRYDIWNPWWPTVYTVWDSTLDLCPLDFGMTYFFEINVGDENGHWSGWLPQWVEVTTGYHDYCGEPHEDSVYDKLAALPVRTALHECYPNPFNLSTMISFDLAQPATVSMEIFNVLGERVKSLLNSELPAGRHEFIWDGNNETGATIASGVYLIRFQADNYSASRKLMLLK